MKPDKKVVVTGAAGALGSAYIRALVPHGYEVIGIDKSYQKVTVYKRLPKDPYEILKDNDLTDIRIHGIDLARPARTMRSVFRDVYAVVMTAANPDPHQSRASAAINHRIDMNTIELALEQGVEVIIYLSSLWRLSKLIDGDRIITPEMSAPTSYYGENKQRTIEEMRKLAAQNPEVKFLYNDHGWYPRETRGAPPTNFTDRALQCWVAEIETQQHILKELEIHKNPHFDGNFYGFIVVSKNIPTAEAIKRGHRPFIFDITASEKLGVEHKANIYQVIPEYWKWRSVPVYMY